jgi:hypothetical protein
VHVVAEIVGVNTLARIRDQRARQFWDSKHVVASALSEIVKQNPRSRHQPAVCSKDSIGMMRLFTQRMPTGRTSQFQSFGTGRWHELFRRSRTHSTSIVEGSAEVHTGPRWNPHDSAGVTNSFSAGPELLRAEHGPSVACRWRGCRNARYCGRCCTSARRPGRYWSTPYQQHAQSASAE